MKEQLKLDFAVKALSSGNCIIVKSSFHFVLILTCDDGDKSIMYDHGVMLHYKGAYQMLAYIIFELQNLEWTYSHYKNFTYL